jgi:hypothetical protein
VVTLSQSSKSGPEQAQALAAQPLIDEVGRVTGDFLDLYKLNFEEAVEAVGEAVDEEYGPVLLYQKTIRLQQDLVVYDYKRLVEYSVTEDKERKEALLREFIELAPNTAAFDNVRLEDGLTIQEAWKVEEVLLERMARISQQRASIAPEDVPGHRPSSRHQPVGSDEEGGRRRTPSVLKEARPFEGVPMS